MSAHRPSTTSNMLKLAGAAAVLAASKAIFRDAEGKRPAPSPAGSEPPGAGAHSKREDLITYGVGYVMALILTCAAFAVVHWRWTAGETALGLVFGLALVQAVVHFRCFLHVDLKRAARDDLQLILFSTLIVALMVGGTLVVLFNLRMRMM